MAIDFTGARNFPERHPGTYIEFAAKDSEQNVSEGVRLRASTLFESFQASDPREFRKTQWGWSKSPYRNFDIAPSAFLSNAARHAPSYSERTATASGFASWVYSLYSSPDELAQERGKLAEKQISKQKKSESKLSEELKMQFLARPNSEDLQRDRSPWELIHNGLHLSDEVLTGSYYLIEALRVNGKVLRASPDLVYRHRQTKAVIIVEIKFTSSIIPINLWPNIWAQLWCYSQIAPCLNSDHAIVIGEVWGDDYNAANENSVVMRKSVRRDPRNPNFQNFFEALFNIYCGNR